MIIVVKASKEHVEIEIEDDATVFDLKSKIEELSELPSDKQKLIFKGREGAGEGGKKK